MADTQTRFLALTDEIEKSYPVAEWRVGDVPVWPLARTALYTDLYQQGIGKRAAPGRSGGVARVGRAAADAATPLINLWRCRSDLRHVVLVPHRANALFLGDGVSLDWAGGAWKDRFCDPLIAALHGRGASTLLMQRGDVQRLPRTRPTFSANTVIRWGRLLADLHIARPRDAWFPDRESVVAFLVRNDAPTLSLSEATLRSRAAEISATARGYEHVLAMVRPSQCFIVEYSLGLGHALALACRRRRVLSIELQRAGRNVQHGAYRWFAVPENGYAILPAVFWAWTEADAAAIDAWTKTLKRPWHRTIHGGQPQLAAWLDDSDPETRASDARLMEIRAKAPAEREILVALQILDGHEDVWNSLAAFIERGPPQWRWWLRQHPSTLGSNDPRMGRLPAIRRPNVLTDVASSAPLPALLRHMDALVTVTSGAAVEASMFGLRSFFLSPAARDRYPHLFETGRAEAVTGMDVLEQRLRALPPPVRSGAVRPDLSRVLSQLIKTAQEYAELCKSG